MRAMGWLPACWLVAMLSGCMTVRIESGDAGVQVVRHVGVLRIELAAPRHAVAGTLAGVGLAATPMGWSAGYTQQRWASIGPECRVVLWLHGDARLDAQAHDALARIAHACVLHEDRTPSSTNLEEVAP